MKMWRWTLLAIFVLLSPFWAEADEDRTGPADRPTEGQMTALGSDRAPLGACPLEHTDVHIEVSGDIVRTRVTQRFSNPFPEPIEALYTFPLPTDAAVRDMEMRVGRRIVAADIRRREEARRTYEAARASGQTASLLDQERPNIFTTQVANIRPGVPVSVTLEYVATAKYEAGAYELAFPMTVGPRYIPGAAVGPSRSGVVADRDRVPDASRITPPVAPPGRSGHDVSLVVDVNAGVAMGAPTSASHPIDVARPSRRRAHIELANVDTLPNRDFVLRWPVSPRRVESGVLTHRHDPREDGYLALTLHPNPAPPTAEITPKELIFVLDTSGSMHGRPMDLGKALMRRLIADLHPDDTFSVLRYDDTTSALSARPLSNTDANRTRALQFIHQLEGSGGTRALAGVRAAFSYPRDPERLRIVVFLTDGYIGNEREVLGEIRKHIGRARLFSFGVGSSVNRYLLTGMALEGRGAARVVTPDEAPDEAVDGFYRRLMSPYLTDIEIDWGGLSVRESMPHRLPDLFAGQPLSVFARYRRPGRGTVRVRGRLAGRPFAQTLSVTLPRHTPQNEAIASVWARQKIGELERTIYHQQNPSTVETITELALRHRLMTRYTSFVAVEHRVVEEADASGNPRQVVVPVELPEGVRPDRLFGASLSLARFQPGDPELRVHAPADARAVTAVFPFGETHELTYEPRLGAWTTRFLVPRGTPEGNYPIVVLISPRSGRQERIVKGYTVDASAPSVDLKIEGTVRPGGLVQLVAEQRFTEADRRLATGTQVEILSDLARLRVFPSGGARPVTLRLTESGRWEGTLRIPEAVGTTLTLSVSAFDTAGNRSQPRFSFDVAAP